MVGKAPIPKRQERLDRQKQKQNEKVAAAKALLETMVFDRDQLARQMTEREAERNAINATYQRHITEMEAVVNARGTQAWADFISAKATTINTVLAAHLAGLWAVMQLSSDLLSWKGREGALICFAYGAFISFVLIAEHLASMSKRTDGWDEVLMAAQRLKSGEKSKPDKIEKHQSWWRSALRWIESKLISFALFCSMLLFAGGVAVAVMDMKGALIAKDAAATAKKAEAEADRVREQNSHKTKTNARKNALPMTTKVGSAKPDGATVQPNKQSQSKEAK